MKTGYFVIGDIHGHFDELVEMLKSWDEAAEQFKLSIRRKES